MGCNVPRSSATAESQGSAAILVNPAIRSDYIIGQLHGKEDNGVRNAIMYVHERMKTLSSRIMIDEKKLYIIRNEICGVEDSEDILPRIHVLCSSSGRC